MTKPGGIGRQIRPWPIAVALLAWGMGLGAAGLARAQQTPTPTPRTAREAELEERLRRLEERLQAMPDPDQVRRLQSRVRDLSDQVDQLQGQLRKVDSAANPTSPPDFNGMVVGPGGSSRTGASIAAEAASASDDEVSSEIGFGGTASGFGPAAEPPSPRFDMPYSSPARAAKSLYGPGFQIRSPDDEFDIQFHDLTQLDGRFYGIPNQKPTSDTFDIARQWLVYNGHLTRPYEYYVSFVDALGSFSALDIFLNVNYDRRLQFRFGRFKTPYAYEFYAQPTEALANGEWSLFFNNFGINRELGTMLWGESVAGRIDYAAGLFNSVPNGQIDLSNDKSVIAFLNFAPFRPSAGSPLENFNVGGSLVAGSQNYAPVPNVLRTIVPTAGSNVVGVPFLAFNDNVVADGPRNLWSLHTAYFYRSLMILGEWESGFEDYALVNHKASRVHLPIESFYVQTSYFLTGETMASRGRVKPLRPFDLRRGRLGPGAWETVFRYADLSLGREVFTAGLADPNNWTNRLYATDLGINWYWNQYIRVLFDWQHAGFGTPVYYRPGRFASASDLFLIRFQVWF